MFRLIYRVHAAFVFVLRAPVRTCCDVVACCAPDTAAAAASGVMQCSQVLPAAPAKCLEKPDMLTRQQRHGKLRSKRIAGQTVLRAQTVCCLRARECRLVMPYTQLCYLMLLILI